MSELMIIGLVLASIAALLHVLFFVLESVLFRHARGRRLLGVRAEHDSPPLRLFAVNQGVYNLALSIVVLVGAALLIADPTSVAGLAIISAGCSVMVVAGLALALTGGRRMLGAALAQALPPLLAVGALLAAH